MFPAERFMLDSAHFSSAVIAPSIPYALNVLQAGIALTKCTPNVLIMPIHWQELSMHPNVIFATMDTSKQVQQVAQAADLDTIALRTLLSSFAALEHSVSRCRPHAQNAPPTRSVLLMVCLPAQPVRPTPLQPWARPTRRLATVTPTTTATLICNVSSALQGTSAVVTTSSPFAPLDPMQSPGSPRVPYAPAAPTTTKLEFQYAGPAQLAQV
jgi:hypothetical protein